MKLEFSHRFQAGHCTVLIGAVLKECRPYLRKTVSPGRRDFGNFPFQVRHRIVSTKPLIELYLFAIWGKSWVLNNLCNVVHPNECSMPAVHLLCTGVKNWPNGSYTVITRHFDIFCTDETSCSRSEKNFPRSYEKYCHLKKRPFSGHSQYQL